MGLRERFYAHITALHPEVTGSCLFVDVCYPNERRTKFLVDCGLFQEKEYNELNKIDFPFASEKVEFVLITHNHADHVGKLPMLCKYGFNGKIYATKSTTKLMSASLNNSYKIMKEDAQRQKSKPIYGEEDIERIFENLALCNLGESIQIDSNIKITYFDNGHIIGAGVILVQISYPGEDDINLLFTGDYKPTNAFKKVQPIPNWVYNLPINVVIESTYGDTNTCEIVYNFEIDVESILRKGNSLFIPVLAQGRAQEILFMLKQMQKDERISKKIPIYLDGNLAHQYTHIYKSGELEIDEDKLDFLPENFHWVDKGNRANLIASSEQKIILTTSGMLDHGPAQLYLPYIASKKNCAIFLTSYCGENTLGRKFLEYQPGTTVKIDDKEMVVEAQIFSTSQFSSHAKADELLQFLSQFKNLKLVLVNHGEKETKQKFAERVDSANVAKRVEVLGEHTIKLSHYGFIKAMGSKLYRAVREEHQKEKKRSKKRKHTYRKLVCRRRGARR